MYNIEINLDREKAWREYKEGAQQAADELGFALEDIVSGEQLYEQFAEEWTKFVTTGEVPEGVETEWVWKNGKRKATMLYNSEVNVSDIDDIDIEKERKRVWEKYRQAYEDFASDAGFYLYDVMTEEELYEGFAEDWEQFMSMGIIPDDVEIVPWMGDP